VADGANRRTNGHCGHMTTSDQTPAPDPTGAPAPTDAFPPSDAPPSDAPLSDAPPPSGHPVTSVVVGAAATAWDRLAPGRGDRIGLREVAVGAVFEMEDAAAGLLARVRRSRSRPRPRAVVRLVVLADLAREGVARLAARGVVEQSVGRRRAAVALDSLMAAVANAPVVERVVDAQVDRLLQPLMAQILDDVLAQLENEPERVQALIRGQRDSMISELVGRLRQTAAAGDTTVDRLAARLIRRAAEPEPAAAPEPAASTSG